MSQNERETDQLKYRSDTKFPFFLVVIWCVLILFAAYYLIVYMWPDLKQWTTYE